MSINKSILVGRLGTDPEVIHTGNTQITKFSLATTDKYKDKEETDWHNIVCFGKVAEIAGKYLKKGMQVYGRARARITLGRTRRATRGRQRR